MSLNLNFEIEGNTRREPIMHQCRTGGGWTAMVLIVVTSNGGQDRPYSYECATYAVCLATL
jgi:hypothetical protein